MTRLTLTTLLASALLLAACDGADTAKVPAPLDVSADSTGYYCGMLLVEHPGPKGQIHLRSQKTPVWFSSARDTIVFTRLPAEPKDVAAVYVSDMARARNWAQPEPGAWVKAEDAWFVIESAQRGGMGAPEAVPFSDAEAARRFAAEQGGRIMRLAEIPDSFLLDASAPPAPAVSAAPGATPVTHGAHGAHGDAPSATTPQSHGTAPGHGSH